MPVNETVYVSRQTFQFDMRILHCGLETISSQDAIDDIYDRFVLEYVADGDITLTHDGKDFVLSKGDLFVAYPNIKTKKSPLNSTFSSIYYLAFTGENSAFILEKCGFTYKNPTLHLSEELRDEVQKSFDDIMFYVSENTFLSMAQAHSVMMNLLCILFGLDEVNRKKIQQVPSTIAERAKTIIDKNYNKDITVSFICRALHVSNSYLIRLFRRYYNTTVNGYLYNKRMAKAVELLTMTDDSVENICRDVGFHDTSNFYRSFKTRTGVSPMQYRMRYRISTP